MKTAIVTDSTANLSKKILSKYNIKVIPVPFIIDGHEYLEGVNITNEEFYKKLNTTKEFPTTSQPPVGELINLYEKLATEGYDAVVSIHIAGTISGLVQTLNNLVSQLKDIKLYPIDSSITEVPMGWMVIKAARMAQVGKDPQEIIAAVEKLKKEYSAVFIVDDLKNLAHGGRLSNASAFIGTMLKIKPILEFDKKTDKITAFEKVRSMKKAMKRAVEITKEQIAHIDFPYRLMIIDANAPKKAEQWKKELQQNFPNVSISVNEFDPVVAIHLGEGALGLGWIRDIDKDKN